MRLTRLTRPSRSPLALRLAAVLAVGALATTACGARLTPAQRTAALSQGGGSGIGAGGPGSGDLGTGTSSATGPTKGPTGTTLGTGTTGTTGSRGTKVWSVRQPRATSYRVLSRGAAAWFGSTSATRAVRVR